MAVPRVFGMARRRARLEPRMAQSAETVGRPCAGRDAQGSRRRSRGVSAAGRLADHQMTTCAAGAVALRPFERRHLPATLEWANDPELARLLNRSRTVAHD